MPKNHRVSVALNDDLYRVLQGIRQFNGQSMSGFIGEFLEQAMPVLERMLATFQRVKNTLQEKREEVVASLERAQDEIEPVISDILSQRDLFLSRLDDVLTTVGEVETRPRPPVTNRGDTPTVGKSENPRPARNSGRFSRKRSGGKKTHAEGIK